MLGPLYIAELALAKWRGRLVGLFQINIVVCILLAYFVALPNRLAIQGSTEWRWQLRIGYTSAFALIMLLHTTQSSLVGGKGTGARGTRGAYQNIYWRRRGRAEIIVSIDEAKAAQAAKLFTPRYKFPDFPRHRHWCLQPTDRHQRHPLLSQ